jgi:glutathione S-transferase
MVNLMTGDQLKEEFIKINPQHTIPTLDDNGFVIWESRAIAQYLAESKGKNYALISNIPKERALIQQRLYFDLGTLMPRLSAIYVSEVYLFMN